MNVTKKKPIENGFDISYQPLKDKSAPVASAISETFSKWYKTPASSPCQTTSNTPAIDPSGINATQTSQSRRRRRAKI